MDLFETMCSGLDANVCRGMIQASKEANPQHQYSAADRLSSYAETGVYFLTLMDAAKNAVPLKYLKVLFGMWKSLFAMLE